LFNLSIKRYIFYYFRSKNDEFWSFPWWKHIFSPTSGLETTNCAIFDSYFLNTGLPKILFSIVQGATKGAWSVTHHVKKGFVIIYKVEQKWVGQIVSCLQDVPGFFCQFWGNMNLALLDPCRIQILTTSLPLLSPNSLTYFLQCSMCFEQNAMCFQSKLTKCNVFSIEVNVFSIEVNVFSIEVQCVFNRGQCVFNRGSMCFQSRSMCFQCVFNVISTKMIKNDQFWSIMIELP
jgi:hypothetical protein